MQEIGYNQARRAQSRVAGGDRGHHHAKQGKDAAECAEPCHGYFIHKFAGIGAMVGHICLQVGVAAGKRYRGCGPDKGHQSFGHHGSVKNRTGKPLVF